MVQKVRKSAKFTMSVINTEACRSIPFPRVVKTSGQQTGFWVIRNARLKVKFQPKLGVAGEAHHYTGAKQKAYYQIRKKYLYFSTHCNSAPKRLQSSRVQG